ncbi:MAG: hypothetical protein JSW59_07120 [Phycisphaerales bacterium]|nr:MAG: hypothetical protein JSW59_07120 [Phycisphaerales bacterium]
MVFRNVPSTNLVGPAQLGAVRDEAKSVLGTTTTKGTVRFGGRVLALRNLTVHFQRKEAAPIGKIKNQNVNIKISEPASGGIVLKSIRLRWIPQFCILIFDI